MAVNFNPYVSWVNHLNNADYRCTDTQVNNLVRKQLAQEEYLTRSNRVNPGPNRTARTRLADQTAQVPNVFASDDLWGWQDWVTRSVTFPSEQSDLSDNLFEVYSPDQIPGTTYYPYEEVGGATVSQIYTLDYNFKFSVKDLVSIDLDS